ncbi:hypothetical protein ColTof3_14800 [Colletotrichum tofieldiae]|nr:hypothetical protein ColTof3_14800 [Colletotrichum tofieldiae]
MDCHLAQLAGMALGGVVVSGIQSEGAAGLDGVVYVDTALMAMCAESEELNLCVKKRFSSKKFKSLKPIALTFVLTTLCSRRDCMLYIWEFLQITRRSYGHNVLWVDQAKASGHTVALGACEHASVHDRVLFHLASSANSGLDCLSIWNDVLEGGEKQTPSDCF